MCLFFIMIQKVLSQVEFSMKNIKDLWFSWINIYKSILMFFLNSHIYKKENIKYEIIFKKECEIHFYWVTFSIEIRMFPIK